MKFNNYHGPSRTIALHNYYTTSSTTYYSYHYIDDIEVSYIPECEHAEDLMVSNLCDTGLTFSWSPVGEETEWLVIYGTNSILVNDTVVNITDLTPNTEYTFEVRSICGVGDTSESAILLVRTPCSPISLPYSEDFESYGSAKP